MDTPEAASITSVTISALTDTGMERDHNEDNFIVCPDLSKPNWLLIDKPFNLSQQGCLLVVADGMGGTNAGEVASAIAVESVKNYFSSLDIPESISPEKAEKHLRETILKAHDDIVRYSQENPSCSGMGTTIIIGWILRNKLFLSWCGDSRAYLYNKRKELKGISKDHSLVWELVEAGQLTADEADFHPNNNIITQSLGDSSHPPVPDFMEQTLEAGDKIMLCSDGLNNMLTSEEIEAILFQEKPLGGINKDLIDAANNKGGKDNITTVLVELAEVAVASTPAARITVEKIPFLKISIWLLFLIAALLVTLFVSRRMGKNKIRTEQSEIVKQEEKKNMNKPASIDNSDQTVKTGQEGDAAVIKMAGTKTIIKKKDTLIDAFELRVKNIEKIMEDWNKISFKLDSVREKQSKDISDTVNTKHLFQLITLQEEFEEISSQKKFKILLTDWEFQKDKEDLLKQKYKLESLDEGIILANEKLNKIRVVLEKVL